MMTTAAEKVAVPAVKKEEKVEKRRALGRGLESLLPGPRVVAAAAPHLPSPPFAKEEKDGAPGDGEGAGETKVPRFARDDSPGDSSGGGQASQEMETKRAGAPAPHEPSAPAFEEQAGEVISIQAVADDRILGNRVANVPVEAIDKNPYQTRYVFDEDMLRELSESIKEHGVVQPVVVRPAEEEGRYILVLGERRLRASKMAGKDTIPALVRRLSLQQAAEMTVLENVVRQDLNPVEQAEAFRVLSKEFNLTQMQIAQRIGVSRETVSNYMRLLRLPEDVMKHMLEGRLSCSEAREILSLDNTAHIQPLAEEVVTKHLKIDQIEERVQELNGFGAMPRPEGAEQKRIRGARWMDPNVRAAQT